MYKYRSITFLLLSLLLLSLVVVAQEAKSLVDTESSTETFAEQFSNQSTKRQDRRFPWLDSVSTFFNALDMSVPPNGGATGGEARIIRLGTVLDIAGDGQHLYSVGGRGLVRWSVAEQRYLEVVDSSVALRSVALQPLTALPAEGGGAMQWLAAGDEAGNLALWQVSSTGINFVAKYQQGDGSSIHSLTFSPDGRYLASGNDSGQLHLWALPSASNALTSPCLITTLLRHEGRIYDSSFTNDGRFLASAGQDGHAIIWNIASAQPIHILPRGGLDVMALSFSPDGTRLATGSFDSAVRVWDVSTGAMLWTSEVHARVIHDLNFASDGQGVYSVSEDGQLIYATAHTSHIIYEAEQPIIAMSQFFPAAGQPAGTMALYVAESSSIIRTLTLQNNVTNPAQATAQFLGHGSAISALSIVNNAQSSTVAIGDLRGYISLWSLDEQQQLLQQRKVHEGSILRLASSPDGRWLASGGQNGILHISHAENLQPVVELSLHRANITALAFNADSTLLASGSMDKSVRLWQSDGTNWQEKALLEGAGLTISQVLFVANQLWATSHDGVLRAWNFDGSLQYEFNLERGSLYDMVLEAEDFLITSDNGIFSLNISPESLASGKLPVQPINPQSSTIIVAVHDHLGQRWLSLSKDGKLSVWSRSNTNPIPVDYQGGQILSLATLGGDALVGSRNGTLTRFNLANPLLASSPLKQAGTAIPSCGGDFAPIPAASEPLATTTTNAPPAPLSTAAPSLLEPTTVEEYLRLGPAQNSEEALDLLAGWLSDAQFYGEISGLSVASDGSFFDIRLEYALNRRSDTTPSQFLDIRMHTSNNLILIYSSTIGEYFPLTLEEANYFLSTGVLLRR